MLWSVQDTNSMNLSQDESDIQLNRDLQTRHAHTERHSWRCHQRCNQRQFSVFHHWFPPIHRNCVCLATCWSLSKWHPSAQLICQNVSTNLLTDHSKKTVVILWFWSPFKQATMKEHLMGSWKCEDQLHSILLLTKKEHDAPLMLSVNGLWANWLMLIFSSQQAGKQVKTALSKRSSELLRKCQLCERLIENAWSLSKVTTMSCLMTTRWLLDERSPNHAVRRPDMLKIWADATAPVVTDVDVVSMGSDITVQMLFSGHARMFPVCGADSPTVPVCFLID